MNLKVVLRTYGLLRQLSDDETALLETLRGLTDNDREQLAESLAPVKAAVRKRVRKPQVKSPRAESLATAIGDRVKSPRAAAGVACAHTGFNGDSSVVCAELEDNPIHDPTAGYAGYHEFVAPKAVSAAGD